MEDGRPRFVTALGETDVVGGWRERQGRWRRGDRRALERGRAARAEHAAFAPPARRMLVVLNSERGSCGESIVNSFRHDVVCSLPGYLRGLGFVGPVALVGLSTIREKHIFGGLPVQQRYPRLRCGVAVVDVRTGRQARACSSLPRAAPSSLTCGSCPMPGPHDPERGERSDAPGRHRAGVRVLAPPQRRGDVRPRAVMLRFHIMKPSI